MDHRPDGSSLQAHLEPQRQLGLPVHLGPQAHLGPQRQFAPPVHLGTEALLTSP